ncbi:MAG: hypothetical protein ALECFALPRED_008707 [Alectoria fallacina]|uniref:Uncharacterized protein n=1 Tax=Alectoria fallacina TaxID=1903189 RepID=A0A8H3PGU3_9LECA|nr:MAG: hypothetical protein ALECFALPRED_008707 [Alectoria fallacina]
MSTSTVRSSAHRNDDVDTKAGVDGNSSLNAGENTTHLASLKLGLKDALSGFCADHRGWNSPRQA